MTRMGPDDFLDRLHKTFSAYDNRKSLRAHIVPPALPPEDQSHWLECHARRYVIDHILAGLGWNIHARRDLADHIQNLNIEYPVLSAETGHRRFLDYLGYEQQSGRPLLIVEAKRPSLSLPSVNNHGGHPAHHPAADMIQTFCGDMKSGARQSSSSRPQLTQQWQKYLRDLRDYFCSAAAQAGGVKRLVITNGEWLIIFQDPPQAFGDDSEDAGEVVVYQDREAVLANSLDIFERLAYKKLTDEAPWLRPNEVSGAVSDENIAGVARALLVAYDHTWTGYGKVPHMHVTPLLLLVGRDGGCIVVEPGNPAPSEVPRDSNGWTDHMNSVAKQADQLLEEVERQLGHKCRLLNIKDYFENERLFGHWPAVKERRTQPGKHREFVVVTGDRTHFLVSGSWGSCTFHTHENASAKDCGHQYGCLDRPSTFPRCYFPSRVQFHCAHRETYETKKTPVTQLNRYKTGTRSAGNDEAFCELWKIDQFLCCRSCVFLPACEQSKLFQLPCLAARCKTSLQTAADCRE
ncbi:hypothetical protein JCM19992_19380 [Thermostilla marina]